MNLPSSGQEGVRPTSRTVALLAFVAVLAVGAIALRTPVPLFAALPLLLVPLASAASRPASLQRVDLAWESRGIGPELEITGTLTGAFGTSAANVEIAPVRLPGAVERQPPAYDRTPSEIRFSLSWTLQEPTISTVAPGRVIWKDPLGLLEHTLVGARPLLPIERYPPELHRLGAIRLDRTLQIPGEARSQRLGASGEFFGIRDAAPGEPPRQINWKASARLGRLLANDFLIDRTGDLLILLDVRPTILGPVVDERLLGIARAGILGIVDALLRGKVRVGLATFGEFVQAVPLSSGKVHRIRIREVLFATRRASVAGPPERCTFGLRRYFRPGLTTLVVSSWSGDRGFELLPYLRRSGFPGAMVSPSPLALGREAGSGQLDEEQQIVRRLEGAERRAYLAALWQHGPVVDWTDYWSLEPLVRFLHQPTRRRVT